MSVANAANGVDVRSAFSALAELFCYPNAFYAQSLQRAAHETRRCDRGASQSLEAFDAAISELDMSDLQWAFSSTFDLAPSCNPYLGAHVFGDESRERARFMVGLRQRYAEAGKEEPRELPDHLAVVLAFAHEFGDEEWTDLGRLILVPALVKMDALLSETANPYRHLVAATRQLAATAFGDLHEASGAQQAPLPDVPVGSFSGGQS